MLNTSIDLNFIAVVTNEENDTIANTQECELVLTHGDSQTTRDGERAHKALDSQVYGHSNA